MERLLFRTIKCAYSSVISVPLYSSLGRGFGTSCNKTVTLLSSIQWQNQEIFRFNLPKAFHTERPNLLRFDGRDVAARRELKKTKEEGTEGEKELAVDNVIRGFGDIFPDETTPDLLFDGVKFSDLPVVHISVTRNNTCMCVTDAKGLIKLKRSCGFDGFKNAKKGTNVAAQVSAQNLAMKALDKGFKNVRISIKGLGPGRMASVKGIALGGLNVVSITDATPIAYNISPRPRKVKRN